MDARVIILMLLIGLFGLWLLYCAGLMKKPSHIAAALILMLLALGSRLLVFDYVTPDYRDFLSKWVDFFRQNGGFRALNRPIGNYNIPYLYFLALFSYFDTEDLYLIKLLSVFFDVILAYAGMQLLARCSKSIPRRLACFYTILFLPTVFLNGSLWGQCDSSYTAMALLGIYFALDDRPVPSMICAAVSFGFKLQAVFVLPVYAVLWMQGKFNWKHFLIFPLTYIVLVLPAVLLGRPFLDTVTLYFNQTGSIGSGLNYNSPSVYSFFQYSLPEKYNVTASNIGIAAAFVFMLGLLAVCYVNRKRLNSRSVLAAALLFSMGIPFLLPHMHDRYFFAADVLSLVLIFSSFKYTPLALLVQFASFLGYYAYLKGRFLLLMDRGAFALIIALVLTAIYFVSAIKNKNFNTGKNIP